MDTPLFSECVVGYRKWNLADWVLTPLNFGSPWRPGVNKAVCQPQTTRFGYAYMDKGPHEHAPADGCHCGLNAFFEPKGIREGGDVLGAVVAWGDLRVHPDGFRAEYAQIVGLLRESVINDPGGSLDLTAVSALYGVPILRSVEELQMEASKHGSPLPESLRPAEQDEYFDSGYASGGLTTASYSNVVKQVWTSSNTQWTTPGQLYQYTPPPLSPAQKEIKKAYKAREAAVQKARKKYTAPPKKKLWGPPF